MKILITGVNGFMGKHLSKRLAQEKICFFGYDIGNTDEELKKWISEADFIVHLAGVMRPLSNDEFYNSNANLTKKIVDLTLELKKQIPILFASSTQAVLDNDYGRTKKMGEDFMFSSGLPVYVFRFTNAFGKWGKPNYNSVASTFMYNIANNLDIFIRERDFTIHFIYIDDIVETILKCINGSIKASGSILSVEPVYDCTIGHLADLLYYFKTNIDNHDQCLLKDDFERKLYISFCDYLKEAGR